MVRNVAINSISERGNIIEFYNSIFVAQIKEVILQFKPVNFSQYNMGLVSRSCDTSMQIDVTFTLNSIIQIGVSVSTDSNKSRFVQIVPLTLEFTRWLNYICAFFSSSTSSEWNVALPTSSSVKCVFVTNSNAYTLFNSTYTSPLCIWRTPYSGAWLNQSVVNWTLVQKSNVFFL